MDVKFQRCNKSGTMGISTKKKNIYKEKNE